MAGFYSNPTNIRYDGHVIAGTNFLTLSQSLNGGERLVVLTDSMNNRSGHSAHRGYYVDTQDEYDALINQLQKDSYYILNYYAV